MNFAGELKASVQYDDYLGTSAADGSDDSLLRKMAMENGIDLDRYFIFGIQVYHAETDDPTVYLLAADSKETRALSFDFVQEHINRNGGVLPYVKFQTNIKWGDVPKIFKRFEIIWSSKFRNVKSYEETERF